MIDERRETHRRREEQKQIQRAAREHFASALVLPAERVEHRQQERDHEVRALHEGLRPARGDDPRAWHRRGVVGLQIEIGEERADRARQRREEENEERDQKDETEQVLYEPDREERREHLDLRRHLEEALEDPEISVEKRAEDQRRRRRRARPPSHRAAEDGRGRGGRARETACLRISCRSWTRIEN